MVNKTIYNSKVPSSGNLMVKKNLINNKFDVTTQQLIDTTGSLTNYNSDRQNFNLWRKKNS